MQNNQPQAPDRLKDPRGYAKSLNSMISELNAPGFNKMDSTAVQGVREKHGISAVKNPYDPNGVFSGGGGAKTFIPGVSSLSNTGPQQLGGGGFGGASGGIGANPFGGAAAMQPRSVATQMFNRPAYQRNRVTTGQMGEMNRANQDRFRAEVKPLSTAFDRNFAQAQAQQQLADTAASDQYANQFFGLTNQYNQQQNSMNQQMLMPMLSQLFGGF